LVAIFVPLAVIDEEIVERPTRPSNPLGAGLSAIREIRLLEAARHPVALLIVVREAAVTGERDLGDLRAGSTLYV
jgi:hypothetical protein